MRVKCLAQEHNTMSPASSRTRTARSGVESTNQETTAPLLSGGGREIKKNCRTGRFKFDLLTAFELDFQIKRILLAFCFVA